MARGNGWCSTIEKLHALTVLRPLLQDGVVARLLAFGAAQGEPQRLGAYCEFVSALYSAEGDLGLYLLRLVQEGDNPVLRLRAAGRDIPPLIQQSLEAELAVLTALTGLVPDEMFDAPAGIPAPRFANTKVDFGEVYKRRLAEVATRGYGIYAAYHMFTLDAEDGLAPVKNPDPQRLSELTGYEREREQILVNTRALLRGAPANNILLYGDAGTGKSSAVKAIGNEYADAGLRLVEVRKNQLYRIPSLMDALAENPLKFILFIDDLSFPADDADFTALKAILEGNVSARPRNIVVYATSNRRHMVKMKFSDRQGGDEVHLGDTLEEEASLAARFGLTITFLRPDRELYASIVCSLAEEYGVALPADELVAKAEAHALRHGGRSPRTAKQFIQFVKAAEGDYASDLV